MSRLLSPQTPLMQRTLLLMGRILLIFGIPAALAGFGGHYIDERYGFEPYGSLILFLCAVIFSWTLVIRLYLQMERERREYEARETQSTQEVE